MQFRKAIFYFLWSYIPCNYETSYKTIKYKFAHRKLYVSVIKLMLTTESLDVGLSSHTLWRSDSSNSDYFQIMMRCFFFRERHKNIFDFLRDVFLNYDNLFVRYIQMYINVSSDIRYSNVPLGLDSKSTQWVGIAFFLEGNILFNRIFCHVKNGISCELHC